LKVAFANEVGAISQELGIDGRRVMAVFREDRQLNVSARYLRPGFGFGGSCLPKDLRAMAYAAKELDLATPLLASIIPSNDAHIQRVVDAVLDSGKRRVALLGLSFKPGSDDLRESPFVRLAEALIGRGLWLRIHDPDVAYGTLFGRNRSYIDERLPHLGKLLADDWRSVVDEADIVIVGKDVVGGERLDSCLRGDQLVIDLVGTQISGNVMRPWDGAASERRPIEPLGVAPAG
jgi:GDP-mannose 6-dehydrogenase